MNTNLRTLIGTAALLLSAPVFACGGGGGGGGGGTVDPSCAVFNISGGSATADDGSAVTVTASAWYESSGTLKTAGLASYSGGLGVLSGTETSGSNPDHATDNSNSIGKSNEWIMLSFSKAVTLEQISIGWASNDADVVIMNLSDASLKSDFSAWNHVSTVLWNSYNGLDHGYQPTSSYPLQSNELGISLDECSSYWLVGAARLGAFGTDYNNDYFKLLSVAACTNCAPTSPGQPSTGVPEPGSLALAGLGLLGVLRMRRRRA